jgi:hypothetical protein
MSRHWDALLAETRRCAALAVPAHRTLVVVNRAHERFSTPLLADPRTRAVTVSRSCRCGEYTGAVWAIPTACWPRGGGPGRCQCES